MSGRSRAAENLSGSAIENLRDSVRLVGIATPFAMQRVFEIMPRAMNFIGSAAVRLSHTGKCLADLLHPPSDPREGVENRLGVRSVGSQMRLAFSGNAVELSRALLFHARVPDLVEISQRWINHARTGNIEPARPLLDRFNKLIAVRWMLGQERQDHQLDVNRIELASTRKVTAAKTSAAVTKPMSSAVPAKTAAETSGRILRNNCFQTRRTLYLTTYLMSNTPLHIYLNISS